MVIFLKFREFFILRSLLRRRSLIQLEQHLRLVQLHEDNLLTCPSIMLCLIPALFPGIKYLASFRCVLGYFRSNNIPSLSIYQRRFSLIHINEWNLDSDHLFPQPFLSFQQIQWSSALQTCSIYNHLSNDSLLI